MTPYTMLSSGLGTNEAKALSARLSAWHDSMVAHERRLRAGSTGDACGDECPHAEAHALWSEAVATFGARAQDLGFLRSRAEARRARTAAGAGYARAWWRNKDIWGDVVSPNPSLRDGISTITPKRRSAGAT